MAGIRGITLSNAPPCAPAGRDVERALSAPRPADALAPVRPPATGRPRSPVGHYRSSVSRSAGKRRTPAVCGRVNIRRSGSEFSRLRRLLALLPDVVQTTTGNPSSPAPVPDPQARLWIMPFRHGPGCAACQRAAVYPSHNAEPGPIRDRNDALERLRCIRRWFESSEQ